MDRKDNLAMVGAIRDLSNDERASIFLGQSCPRCRSIMRAEIFFRHPTRESDGKTTVCRSCNSVPHQQMLMGCYRRAISEARGWTVGSR